MDGHADEKAQIDMGREMGGWVRCVCGVERWKREDGGGNREGEEGM